MKTLPLPLLLAALLLGACDSASGPGANVEGEYTLSSIDGKSIDGLPVRVISGTRSLQAGAYNEAQTLSVWGPDDRSTTTDHGRYEVEDRRVIFTSEQHFTSDGYPAGQSGGRVDTATIAGRELTITGTWTYHWTRK